MSFYSKYNMYKREGIKSVKNVVNKNLPKYNIGYGVEILYQLSKCYTNTILFLWIKI